MQNIQAVAGFSLLCIMLDDAVMTLFVMWLQMKKVLSANAEASISVESIMNDVDVRGKMTRDDFEKMAQPLLSRVAQPLQTVWAPFSLCMCSMQQWAFAGRWPPSLGTICCNAACLVQAMPAPLCMTQPTRAQQLDQRSTKTPPSARPVHQHLRPLPWHMGQHPVAPPA